MDWLSVIAVAGAVLAEANPLPDAGLVIDLLDMQWWQAILLIIGTLGLSPAPWIAGLAAGKIQFAAVARQDFERQMKEKDDAHARELEARDRYHAGLMEGQIQRYADSQAAVRVNAEAAERNKERADRVTDALLELGSFIQGTQHFMESALEAGQKEVTERGT